MKRYLLIVGLVVMVGAAGCAKQSPSPEGGAKGAAKAAKREAMAAPAGSKLAKVTAGMKGEDVAAILGKADDEASHETGKRWVPYNMGTDVRRMVWAYKGVGRVVFKTENAFKGGRYVVDHTEYDPDEDGLARK
jgi:hypothetical protein